MKDIIHIIDNIKPEIWAAVAIGWSGCWILMKICDRVSRWSAAKIARDRRSLDAEYDESLEKMKVKSRPLFEMEVPSELPDFPLTRGMKKSQLLNEENE